MLEEGEIEDDADSGEEEGEVRDDQDHGENLTNFFSILGFQVRILYLSFF